MWWIIVELLYGKLPDMCGEAPRLALCPRLLLIIMDIYNNIIRSYNNVLKGFYNYIL